MDSPSVSLVSPCSPNLLHAYGEPSRGGKGDSILEFLISKLRINFVMWNADPDVLSQVCYQTRS